MYYPKSHIHKDMICQGIVSYLSRFSMLHRLHSDNLIKKRHDIFSLFPIIYPIVADKLVHTPDWLSRD